MQPVCESTTARAELHQLRHLQETLSTELTRHASQLRSVGALPPDDLVDGLIAFRIRLIKLTEAARIDPRSEFTLETVYTAIVRTETQDRAIATLNRVLALVHTEEPAFSGLTECQVTASQMLARCAATANDETNADVAALTDGSHPLNALLYWVDAGDEISDEEWMACQTQVTATWGRPLATAIARGKIRFLAVAEPVASISTPAIPLVVDSPPVDSPSSAVAVVTSDLLPQSDNANIHDFFDVELKGEQTADVPHNEPHAPSVRFIAGQEPLDYVPNQRLTIYADAEDVSPEQTAAAPLTTVGWDVLDAAGADDSVFDINQDSIFDTIGNAGATQSSGRKSRSLDMKLLSEDPYHWAKSQPIRAASLPAAVPANGNVGIFARRALQADAASRRTMISQVSLQLLWDDRADLAYHLTRSSEHHLQGDAYVLPSWVMHALALSRHLCYSKGEIARLLEDDLRQFKPELLNSSNPEWNAGTGFFLRAAALVPALLASSPSAATILRSFRITPGLSHLYNYCSRVLTYGQQLQGQAADLFTPDCDLSKWQREIETLQQTVETWLPETIKKYSLANRTSLLFLHAHWTLTASPTIRHPEAVRLWSKWQEVFRIVSKLLKPIATGQETERNWVKSEIDRLTQSIQLESAVSDATVAVGAITFPQEAMLAVIREAIDYASRWLRLCASKPAQGRTLASRDAELLRDEILDRTDGVITELAAYSRSHEPVRTKAGIACLCRTIEHLRAIFSPHSTLALRENDPRHVVSGELLKIPHLRFNEQWLPTVDPVTLETELLSHLSHEQRDWRQAFEMQSTQHDHVATGRILELNVWRTEQERAALSQRRQSEIDDCRQHLTAEVKALSEHLSATIHKRILSDQVQASLVQRLQRLELIAAQTVDFAEAQRELQGLRLAVDQRARDAAQGGKLVKPTVMDRAISSTNRPAPMEPTDPTQPNNGWAWDEF